LELVEIAVGTAVETDGWNCGLKLRLELRLKLTVGIDG
jgi:hypothetical protein